MSQWREHAMDNLVVNMHNEGESLSRELGWECGQKVGLWQVLWIQGLEAKSRTPLEPTGLWQMSGCDGDFCILIEDSLQEKASGFQQMWVRNVFWGFSNQSS